MLPVKPRPDYTPGPDIDPNLKYVSCVCGYTVVASKEDLKILKHHQSLCRKFKGLPPEEEPK